MKALLAIDLDQTLIYSRRCAGPVDDPVWVEHLDGEPLSLMTRRAQDLLAGVQAEHTVVPVTTRTPEQLARVTVAATELALACNGGVLLRAGARDRDWDAWIADELSDCAPAHDAARHFGDFAWARSWRQVEDLFVYAVAHDREAIPAAWLATTSAWAQEHGWRLSVQGRKAYAVPTALSKGVAARRLAAQLGAVLLASGDSLLDRDLLEAADWAIRPRHGELEALGYDRVPVTASSGAVAAEEILEALSWQAAVVTSRP